MSDFFEYQLFRKYYHAQKSTGGTGGSGCFTALAALAGVVLLLGALFGAL